MTISYTLEEQFKKHFLCDRMPETHEWEQLVSCPVCNSTELTLLATLTESLETSECQTCGHSFHSRRPNIDWCGKWYSGDWDGGRDHQSQKQGLLAKGEETLRSARVKAWMGGERAKFHYSQAAQNDACFSICRAPLEAGQITDVLSIGCGNGSELKNFKFANCTVNGIEASDHRVFQANRLIGGGIVSSMVEDLSEETFSKRFNLVISNHVVEHCLDLESVMEAVLRVIQPGGWLQISVPNRYKMPVLFDLFYALHPQRFCRNSLAHLMQRYGFEPEIVIESEELRILAKQTCPPGELEIAPQNFPFECGQIRPEAELQKQLKKHLSEGTHSLYGKVASFHPVSLHTDRPTDGGILKFHEITKEGSGLTFSEMPIDGGKPSRYWVK